MTIDIWKDPSIVSFARRDDHKYAYIDSSTIMDVPVMKLLGRILRCPQQLRILQSQQQRRAGGIALILKTEPSTNPCRSA